MHLRCTFLVHQTDTCLCCPPPITTLLPVRPPAHSPGQQQSTAAQPAQLQQQNALVSLAMALSMPQIHGDERDAIIARWNQVQASYGSGIGYFTQAGAFVEFKSDDAFCRFKVKYVCFVLCYCCVFIQCPSLSYELTCRDRWWLYPRNVQLHNG